MTTLTKAVAPEELVVRLRKRDASAMGVLYDQYSKTLYGIVLRIVKSPDLAEDVLQEGFVKIWSSIENYDEEKGRFFTWMLNICRNLAIDKLRSKQYRQELRSQSIDDSASYLQIASDNGIDSDSIGIKELTLTLKPEQKHIIDLLYFQGYSQSEAAEKLNLPLGTLKTRARAALKYLRTII